MIKNKIIIILFFLFTSFAFSEISQTKELNKLFKNLKKIDDSGNTNFFEKEIWAIWNKHPNDDKLTNKLDLGTELMYEGSYGFALKVFTNVIKTDPSWSEAWNKRATLLFLMEEYEKSLDDIDKVLAIEPRHFGALSGQAQIFIRLKEYEKAVKALKKAKKIYPSIKGNDLIPKLEKLFKGLDI